MIYRYIKGVVQPERLRYCLVMDIAQYLDENDVVVYNSLVESFERIHKYDEEKVNGFEKGKVNNYDVVCSPNSFKVVNCKLWELFFMKGVYFYLYCSV